MVSSSGPRPRGFTLPHNSDLGLLHTLFLSWSVVSAGEEEAQSADHRVLHRRGSGVFQHRQLQLPHGHHQ